METRRHLHACLVSVTLNEKSSFDGRLFGDSDTILAVHASYFFSIYEQYMLLYARY